MIFPFPLLDIRFICHNHNNIEEENLNTLKQEEGFIVLDAVSYGIWKGSGVIAILRFCFYKLSRVGRTWEKI